VSRVALLVLKLIRPSLVGPNLIRMNIFRVNIALIGHYFNGPCLLGSFFCGLGIWIGERRARGYDPS